jgi:hypothetical protein
MAAYRSMQMQVASVIEQLELATAFARHSSCRNFACQQSDVNPSRSRYRPAILTAQDGTFAKEEVRELEVGGDASPCPAVNHGSAAAKSRALLKRSFMPISVALVGS